MQLLEAFFDPVMGLLLAFWVVVWLLLIAARYMLPRYALKLQKYRDLIPVAAGFSFLGITIGIMAGNSAQPVMNVVLPAVLTFFGGFVTYVIHKGDGSERIVAISILAVMSLAILYGTEMGSKNRALADLDARNYNEKLIEYNAKMDLYTYEMKKSIDAKYASFSNERKDSISRVK